MGSNPDHVFGHSSQSIPSLCSSAHSLGENAWLLLGPQDCLPGQSSGTACLRIPSIPSITFFSSRCFLSFEPGQSIHVHFLCSTRQEPFPSASRNFKMKNNVRINSSLGVMMRVHRKAPRPHRYYYSTEYKFKGAEGKTAGRNAVVTGTGFIRMKAEINLYLKE